MQNIPKNSFSITFLLSLDSRKKWKYRPSRKIIDWLLRKMSKLTTNIKQNIDCYVLLQHSAKALFNRLITYLLNEVCKLKNIFNYYYSNLHFQLEIMLYQIYLSSNINKYLNHRKIYVYTYAKGRSGLCH